MLQHPYHCSTLARRAIGILFAFVAAFLLLASVSQPAQSQTYKVIHNFTNISSDGATPYGGLLLDRFGDLYGSTWLGGIYGSGSVYRLSPHGFSWRYTSLYSFKGVTDGAGPGFGALAISDECALFGTTEGGGYLGTSFEVRPQEGCSHKSHGLWRETVLHRFGHGEDGNEPIGSVVFDKTGNFYGTTLLGGAFANGTVFEAKRSGKSWTEKVIYSFGGTSSDAINPVAALTTDANGNLYGTAPAGGASGVGAVFKLSRSGSGWTETVLYSFQGLSDGQNPVGGLVLDEAGNLYGGTFDGGVNGGGTVYELSPSGGGWNFTVLYGFTGGYGGPYNKLTLDRKGNIYSFTNGEGAYGLGSVFKLTPGNGSWTYTDLYDFPGGSNGGLPYGSLAVDDDGNVFGTAVVGGSKNQGVVFEITGD
jgi:uncharacterized repeat protein (TIGR03803 family)